MTHSLESSVRGPSFSHTHTHTREIKSLFHNSERVAHGRVICEDIRFKSENADGVMWRNVAYCLGQLNINDKQVRRLSESFKLYKDALSDQVVYEHFTSLVAKVVHSCYAHVDASLTRISSARTSRATSRSCSLTSSRRRSPTTAPPSTRAASTRPTSPAVHRAVYREVVVNSR